jgi:hypothetical protein
MSIELTESGVLLKQKANDIAELDKYQRAFEHRYKLAIVLWRYFNGLYREALSRPQQQDLSAAASTSDPTQNKINHAVWIRALAKLAHAAAPGPVKPIAKVPAKDGPWRKHHLGGIISTHNLLVDRFFSQPDYLTSSSAMRALVLSMAVTQSSLTMREMFAPLYIRTQVSMDKHLATDIYTTCVEKQIGINDKHCAKALQHMCETFKNTVTRTFEKINMNVILAKYETFHAAAKSDHAKKTHTTSLTAGQALPFPEVVTYLQDAPTENDAADDFFQSALLDSVVAHAAVSNVAASGLAAMMRDESSEDEEEKQHMAETKEEAEAAAQDDAEDAGEEEEAGEDEEEDAEEDEEEDEEEEEGGEENEASESNESTDDDDADAGESGTNDMEDE